MTILREVPAMPGDSSPRLRTARALVMATKEARFAFPVFD